MSGRTDGLVAAFRCLQAMENADHETQVALWRAAKRYASRDKGEAHEASGKFRRANSPCRSRAASSYARAASSCVAKQPR